MRDISRTMRLIEEGMREGLHVGAQLCAMIDGQVVAEAAVGWARVGERGEAKRVDRESPDSLRIPTNSAAANQEIGVPNGANQEIRDPKGANREIRDPGVAMGNDTLMLWLSAGKPITAAAVLMLWERGNVGLDEPVATYVPEFGSAGKGEITLRHLLTHTAGIRAADPSYPFATWEETLARICAMPMERSWVPGLRAGYHTHASWYVLGEVIRRVTGEACERWVRDHVFIPAGMTDTWMALEPERYAAYGTRVGYLYDTATTPPAPLLNLDTELGAARPRPSASVRGPMRDLARFYEMLRQGGQIGGVRLLKEETIAAMTMRQRVGMYDQTFRQTIDWGLGVILNSAQYGPGIPYQFGPHASPETFGHGGLQSSTGFCDPPRKLVVGLVFNGCPGEAAHDTRLRAALEALYEDLGLV